MLDFVAGREEGKSQENPLNTGRHDASFCLGLNSDCDATTMQIMQKIEMKQKVCQALLGQKLETCCVYASLEFKQSPHYMGKGGREVQVLYPPCRACFPSFLKAPPMYLFPCTQVSQNCTT